MRKMMMTSRWLHRGLITGLGVVLSVGGLSACASREPGAHGWSEARMGEMRERMIERVSSRLSLDAAQKARLQTLADTLQAARKAVRGDAATPRDELAALIQGPTFDRARARGWAEARTQALQGQSPQVIQAFGDFYDSLNPTQQQQVRDHLARMGAGHGGWRGWRG